MSNKLCPAETSDTTIQRVTHDATFTHQEQHKGLRHDIYEAAS